MGCFVIPEMAIQFETRKSSIWYLPECRQIKELKYIIWDKLSICLNYIYSLYGALAPCLFCISLSLMAVNDLIVVFHIYCKMLTSPVKTNYVTSVITYTQQTYEKRIWSFIVENPSWILFVQRLSSSIITFLPISSTCILHMVWTLSWCNWIKLLQNRPVYSNAWPSVCTRRLCYT